MTHNPTIIPEERKQQRIDINNTYIPFKDKDELVLLRGRTELNNPFNKILIPWEIVQTYPSVVECINTTLERIKEFEPTLIGFQTRGKTEKKRIQSLLRRISR